MLMFSNDLRLFLELYVQAKREIEAFIFKKVVALFEIGRASCRERVSTPV